MNLFSRAVNFAKKNHGAAKTRDPQGRESCQQMQPKSTLNEIDKVKRDHFVIESMVLLEIVSVSM